MATTDLIGAHERTVTRPVVPLPSALPGARLTAPLPAAAVAVVDRLELVLFAPEVLPAVAHYNIASFRTAQLANWLYRYELSDVDWESLEFWQDVMRQSRDVLAAAGRLDLIGGDA